MIVALLNAVFLSITTHNPVSAAVDSGAGVRQNSELKNNLFIFFQFSVNCNSYHQVKLKWQEEKCIYLTVPICLPTSVVLLFSLSSFALSFILFFYCSFDQFYLSWFCCIDSPRLFYRSFCLSFVILFYCLFYLAFVLLFIRPSYHSICIVLSFLNIVLLFIPSIVQYTVLLFFLMFYHSIRIVLNILSIDRFIILSLALSFTLLIILLF